jgi:hypothetical protein
MVARLAPQGLQLFGVMRITLPLPDSWPMTPVRQLAAGHREAKHTTLPVLSD